MAIRDDGEYDGGQELRDIERDLDKRHEQEGAYSSRDNRDVTQRHLEEMVRLDGRIAELRVTIEDKDRELENLRRECDRLARGFNDRTAQRDELLGSSMAILAALDVAAELLMTPEHAQDDIWHQRHQGVLEVLAANKVAVEGRVAP